LVRQHLTRESNLLHAALWLIVLFLAQLPHAAADPGPLKIPRVQRAPKLSDFLNGTPREAEAVVTTFWQFDPHDGEPISQPTTAYLSYDSNNLYVGWICKDDPAKIHARVAPRKQIDLDDRVTINIDTFQDHKHAYWFDVNPYGIQYDGRTTDGIGDDPSWEGLWYSEGRVTDFGYVVLEAIPFRTLRFPAGSKQIWNICLARAIQRNSEFSMWPFISHQKLPQFVGQFAPIEIEGDISPGRNVQLIPYAMYSHDSYLDPAAGPQKEIERQLGLDAKFVIHDALTLDAALNPDFSEIGTDDPKVQVNQRFEVVFPERRPFFLENASIFVMPEQLFFSRRIVNPQYGVKLTGSLGRWSVGALASDDRAPGQVLAQGQVGHGDRAMDGVFRAEREFGHQSHVGLFLGGTDFNGTSNKVGSMDLRYVAKDNWTISGQATTTQTDGADGHTSGPGYFLRMRKVDNHASFSSTYTDRSAAMNSSLGYINRTDIRQWETYGNYLWKPPAGHAVMSWGPSFDGIIIHDHKGILQNWSIDPGFTVGLARLTWFSFLYDRSYELYKGQEFRTNGTAVSATSSWFKWLDLSASVSRGSQPNYYPPDSLSPFLAQGTNASATLTLHPQTHLRLDEIYYYTRLATGQDSSLPESLPHGVIFSNHLIRSKVNYQFNRDYSFNAILDYKSLLPNNALVSSTYSKQADATLLFTYLPHPGTAFYAGYANTFQNVEFNAANAPNFSLTTLPGTSTDRQIFVKFNYLLRF
jgi:hypothetical protein